MSLKIKTLQVGQLQTNCFLLWETKNKKTIIIDPGDDAEYIMQTIQNLGLKPKKIIATHGHFDHLLAVNELKLAFQIPFLLPKKDKALLHWYRKSTRHFLGFDPGPPPQPDQLITEKDKLKINHQDLKIIAAPGHTPGGICLYSKKEGILFSGDTIFAQGGVGRTDFPYASARDLEKSIKKLLQLPKQTKIYPGHGEETTIEKELQEFKKLTP